MKAKLMLIFSIALIAVAVGCSNDDKKDSEPADDKKSPETHVHADGTVHEGPAHGDGHTHGAGPHDGTVADWGGGKFHVEFTVDHDKKEAVVYILGDDEKTAVPISTKTVTLAIEDPQFQVELAADPQEGDGEGKSSRFRGNHESLGIVKEYKGTMSGVVDGTPYSGGFEEEAHDH